MIRRRTLLLLATAEALVAPVTRRTTTKLHAIDAVVLEQCAGYAAIPTCFVGTGAFLLGREPEGSGSKARCWATTAKCSRMMNRLARWTSIGIRH